MRTAALAIALLLLVPACSDDDGTEADRFGVGAQCTPSDQCDDDLDDDFDLVCLTGFKGGYCGLDNCAEDLDCPEGSACVNHTDGQSYCFRICLDKGECNFNRDVDNESNCSANIDFVEAEGVKACVPPSAG